MSSCIPRQIASSGMSPVQGGLQRQEFGLVPLGPDHRRVRPGRLAVPGGIDVRTPGDDETVEPADDVRALTAPVGSRTGSPPAAATASA